MADITKHKYIVLGYGVSTLALVNSLQDQGADFIIISQDRFKIWKRARDLDLNFDLVSSHENSFIRGGHKLRNYNDFDKSFPFLTATEYGDYLEGVCKERGHDKKIHECWVNSIHETESCVQLQTTDGVFECDHLIYDADLTPKFDVAGILKKSESLRDKAVLIEGFGDTANMLVSKLVPNGNKVYVRSRSLYTLDKLFWNGILGKVNILDQAEPHWMMWNLRNYCSFLDISHCSYFQQSWLRNPFGKIYQHIQKVPNFFHEHAPHMRPYKLVKPGYMSDANGNPAKYWPCDLYFDLFFSHWKEHMLSSNILLNDPWFFMHMGVLKPCVTATKANESTYIIDGKETHIDEAWSFPPVQTRTIPMTKNGEEVEVTIDTLYKGMLHPKFKRVFFCGTLRPAVGGFGVFAEMYSLFFRKVYQQADVLAAYHANLAKRIKQYQSRHGTANAISNSKWAGYFVQGVMQEIGLGFTWRSDRSFRQNMTNLLYYVVGSTNVLKMELMEGDYKDDELAKEYNDGVNQNSLSGANPVATLFIFASMNQFAILAAFTLGRYFTSGTLLPYHLGYFLCLDRLQRWNLEFCGICMVTLSFKLAMIYMMGTMVWGEPSLGLVLGAQSLHTLYYMIFGCEKTTKIQFFQRDINFDKLRSKFEQYLQVHRSCKK